MMRIYLQQHKNTISCMLGLIGLSEKKTSVTPCYADVLSVHKPYIIYGKY